MDENTQTLIVQVEPAPPSTERLQDIEDLFYLGLPALIVLWGLKRLMQLFSGDES